MGTLTCHGSHVPQPAATTAAEQEPADESILADKLPPTAAAATREESEGETDARVKAALEESSSEQEEDESELEDDAPPQPQPMRHSPASRKKGHVSSLLDTFADGTSDPVKRLRAHLDAEAQEALYAEDSPPVGKQQDATHEDDDFDLQDDAEQWDRIPYELKGKGREDPDEADWFDQGQSTSRTNCSRTTS